MSMSLSLSPEIESVATALGILQPGAGGPSLDTSFFSAPWDHIGRILSNDIQRSALVSAIEGLLPPAEPAVLDAAAPGAVRGCYPLLEQGKAGQIYIVIERAGGAAGSDLSIGIAAEIRAGAGGPSVVADLVLVTAGGAGVNAVAGSDDYPLSIEARAPVGAGSAAIAASLLIVAPLPANKRSSRLNFRVEGVSEGSAPLVFDLSDSAPPIAAIVTALIQLALAEIGDTAGPEVQRCAEALPSLLGLTGDIPPFPFGDLVKDITAFKSWLCALVMAPSIEGTRPFITWMSALGSLVGADTLPTPAPAGTEEDPVVLTLLQAGATPGIAITFGVRSDPQSATPILVISLRAEIWSTDINGTVRAAAALFAIPLSGTVPVTIMERIDLMIVAPASAAPLIAPSDTGGNLAVGSFQAGIRCKMSGGAPTVVPVLELTEVTVSMAGRSTTFDRLDLTNAGTLTAAAESVLSEAISDGLGSGADAANALCTLLGIGTVTHLDIALFASDPLRALIDYYRRLRAEADGWSSLLSAIGTLLGSRIPAAIVGGGSLADPWRINLDALPAPSGSAPIFKLALWDGGDAATPRLCAALRAELSGDRWKASADVQLLSIDLPDGGIGKVQWLSGVRGHGEFTPQADPIAMDNLLVRASGVALDVGWSPGEKLAFAAQIEEISVQADGDPISIGTISFPLSNALDCAKPDFGLGIDPGALSKAARLLLSRAVGSWAGPSAGSLLGLLFGNVPGASAAAEELASPIAQCFDLSTLAQRPLAALRSWVAALAFEPALITADGLPIIRPALAAVQRILTNHCAWPGLEAPPLAIPVSGAGNSANSWSVPLQSKGAEPVEVLVWEGPAGPPAPWSDAALPPLDATAGASELLTAAYWTAGSDPGRAAMLKYRDRAQSIRALERLDDFLCTGDGILPAPSAMPDDFAWTAGDPVAAAHDKLPATVSTVNQILAWVDSLTSTRSPDSWAVLLLAPKLAGADPWELLLSGVDTGDRASIRLRVSGTSPAQVDLGGVAAAHWYAVDLADDGVAPLGDAVACLGRVVTAVQRANPSAGVILVAHSYLGLVAEEFIRAQAASVLGLVTVGTPVNSDFANPLDRADLLDGVQLANALAPNGLVSGRGALGDALDLLLRCYAGWDIGEAGATPSAAPFPAGAFSRQLSAPLDLNGVPALAIFGCIGDSLVPALAQTMTITSQASGKDPTHLAWGVRTGLGLPMPKEGDPDVQATIGLELGRISALEENGADDTPPALVVSIAIGQENSWLLFDPATGVQVRWLELQGKLSAEGGAPRIAVDLRLHDAGLRGDLTSVADLTDPKTPQLLDSLIKKLDDAKTLERGGRLDALLDLLANLGLTRRATSVDKACALADGWTALSQNALAWLSPRFEQLLNTPHGLFGFARQTGAIAGGGPWLVDFSPLPVEVRIDANPWRITVRTTDPGLAVGPDSLLHMVATVPLATLAAEVTGSLTILGTSIAFDSSARTALLSAPWLDRPLSLAPLDPETPKLLASALPAILTSAALTVLVEQLLGGKVRLVALDGLFRNPGAWLSRAESLGNGALPSVDKIKNLLKILADAAGLPVDLAKPLALPGGLLVDVGDTGSSSDPAIGLELRTDPGAPITLWSASSSNATLDLSCHLDLDSIRHVRPGGSLTLSVPVPGSWGAIRLTFGADPAGLSAKVASTSGVDLTLLPSVSGLDTLLKAAGQKLLPFVLDQVASFFDARTPRPAALDDVLSVAQNLDICDNTVPAGQGFSAKADNLAKLLADVTAGSLRAKAGPIADAVVALLQRLLGSAVVPAPSAPGHVVLSASGVLQGTLTIEADFSTNPVGVQLKAQSISAGAVIADISAGLAAGAPVAAIDLRGRFDTGFGLVLTPDLSVALSPGGCSIVFRPLGTGDVAIALAPSPAMPGLDQLLKLAEAWIVPLAGTLLLRMVDSKGVLALPLWPGASKSIEALLVSVNIAQRNSGALSLKTPLPDPHVLLKGLLDGLTNVPIPLPGDFALQAVTDGARYGLALGGKQSFAIGDYSATLFLGLPDTLDPGWGSAGRGLGLLLLDLTNPMSPGVAPVVRLGGLGLGIERKDGAPLISAGGFQLGGGRIYASADIALTGPNAPSATNIYGAGELDKLGMFIGSGDNAKNPVAGSMLQSGGTGDAAPANPPFDLMIASSPADPKFRILFSGQAVLRVEVKKSFGPLHIEDIALLYQAAQSGPGLGSVGVSIDGGISISGFALQADGLTLLVPLAHPAELKSWSVDLAGLAMSFQSSSVSISGGLRKANLILDNGTSVVDYEGALSIQVSGRGFSAVGAYAQVKDPQYGQYSSFFAFLAINMPLGGPPYLYVIGLAGGIGFNRRLLTPRDPASVGSFPLVSAMTGSCSDPMEQLKEIGADIPPCHGAFWLAAGVRFTTFALLQSTVLVTVSVDHGFEVTVLGLMQLQLPPAKPIASIELALSAKYSTVDQVFSLQAALTQNSWLISKDCQLTGGFAFVIWFQGHSNLATPPVIGSPEVLLSIGGYSKFFNVPAYYPTVPRVGIHWNVTNGIVVKGESFFTLTQSAIMFGGALQASYDIDPIRVWFSAELDVLILWDPFGYFADIGVEIGAQFHYDINLFFGSITISISITLGAMVHIEGPPLHGEATVELCIATVTVPFGGEKAPQPFLSWQEVSVKYLEGGDANNPQAGTSAAVASGAVSASDQRDGTEEKPWTVGTQFAVHAGSKMPASGWRLTGLTTENHQDDFGTGSVVVVPCNASEIERVKCILTIRIERKTGAAGSTSWQDVDASVLDTKAVEGYFPASLWDSSKVPQVDPATGKPSQNIGPSDMLKALGSVELSAGVNPEGMLASDIPFASMIEDDLPLQPLSFGPGAQSIAPAFRPARAIRKNGAKPVAEIEARPPELRKVVAAPFAVAASIQDTKAVPSARKDSAGPSAVVPPGGAHVWLLDPEVHNRIAISDKSKRTRVTALDGTGGVLSDTVATSATARAPLGTCRLLITEQRADEVTGWESDTPLLFAGTATALACGATVHAPGPWAPPRRFGRAGTVCWVPAAALCTQFSNLTTRFSFAKGNAPTVIIVRLDRHTKGARSAEPVVEIAGERRSAARIVRSGARVEMIYAAPGAPGAPRAKRDAEHLYVKVTAGEHWRLAGVIGARGGVSHWEARFAGKPHLRLIRPQSSSANGLRPKAKERSPSAALRRATARVTVSALEPPRKNRKRKRP